MPPLVTVTDIHKSFRTPHGTVRAVDGVSFEINEGETLGLVGESGCGKSTLCRAVIRLSKPTAGSIRFGDVEIATLKRSVLRPFRRKMQYIFQDPYASLNPRSTVQRILKEPLIVHGIGNEAEQNERVEWLMHRVGLDPKGIKNFPHEFSGGQRQRIGIARALALDPSFIICDEPVSALDVSIQAQVLNLLSDLQKELNLAYLFVSHDLSVVKHISDRIMVMYLGKIVEASDHGTIWSSHLHPYTQALISAVPVPEPNVAMTKKRIFLEGDIPSPMNIPSGCRFHTLCPYVVEECTRNEPELREVSAGHFVACHLVTTTADGVPSAPGNGAATPDS